MKYVDEEIKNNPYFCDKKSTDMNPYFSDYKLNNYQAFRIMAEIIDKDGKVENFLPTLKEYMEKEFPGDDGANAKKLQIKVNQFLKAWPEIKKHPAFKTSITSMTTGFFSYWENYAPAMKHYRTREDVPTYFDVLKYLGTILDENGKFHEPPIAEQRQWSELVSTWKMDLENDYVQKSQNAETEE